MSKAERLEKRRVAKKVWYEANKERAAAYNKAYREANKEKLKTKGLNG